METPKKTCSKQGGRPKVGIGRIRKYVVSTRLSPERKLRFSALCREAGQPPAEVLRQLIDRGTVRARITREQLDFMAQLKGVARNLNQLTRLAHAKVCRELIEKHGLYLAPGKDDVQRERLREPDKTRYEIHDAIKSSLPKCKSWNELEGKLRVIVKTCSDIFYTIGQKKCPMPSAKIRNYSHSHNLMSQ